MARALVNSRSRIRRRPDVRKEAVAVLGRVWTGEAVAPAPLMQR